MLSYAFLVSWFPLKPGNFYLSNVYQSYFTVNETYSDNFYSENLICGYGEAGWNAADSKSVTDKFTPLVRLQLPAHKFLIGFYVNLLKLEKFLAIS